MNNLNAGKPIDPVLFAFVLEACVIELFRYDILSCKKSIMAVHLIED